MARVRPELVDVERIALRGQLRLDAKDAAIDSILQVGAGRVLARIESLIYQSETHEELLAGLAAILKESQ